MVYQSQQSAGIFSRLLLATLPLSKKLKQWKIEGIINRVGLGLVKLYQTQISPRKGFRCAHRALHQGTSCSAYFANNLQQVGISESIPLQIQRFQQCKDANLILRHSRRNPLQPSLAASLHRSNSRNKQHRRNQCDKSSWCDCDPFICDCDWPDLDCDRPEPNCDIPGLDCDCSDIPCDGGFCDCGDIPCDVGVCDCG